MRNQNLCLALFIVFCLLVTSCSINKMAMKAVSNALTNEGSSDVFTSDPDPKLVADALPFAIKMYESLLQANPNHQGLLRTTGSLYVMYANAFIQKPAEMLPRDQFEEKRTALERAGKLYLRGLDLLYRSLELKKDDVASQYWAAVAGVSSYGLNPFDLGLGGRVGEFLALADRAYELDPDFNSGALDEFFLLFYAQVPESLGGDKLKAEFHFQKAIEKSKGLLASPYVSYAQAVSIPAQDYDTFKACLDAALAINPDADPKNRLVNTISQRKARYLLDSASYFFFGLDADEDWGWEDDEW